MKNWLSIFSTRSVIVVSVVSVLLKKDSKSLPCNNIKAITPDTWEAINGILVAYGQDKGIEKGKQVRIDCTVVSSNIHKPTDCSVLWGCVRVLTRILSQVNKRFDEIDIAFSGHTRRAKRRMTEIMNTKSKKVRDKKYEDLLKVTHMTPNYALNAVSFQEAHSVNHSHLSTTLQESAEKMKEIIHLTYKVIDQTTRRILYDESVPTTEKIVSIFEPHTDIIVKDHRDTFYNHKVCLASGKSNLITDCLILDANPADSELTDQMFDRHKQIYGHYPLKAALDGGFAAKTNLNTAKGKGIKDVCFAKKRGLHEEEMCRSPWVCKRLRRFRPGIESGISWLKRCFGSARCMWKSLSSFHGYVWASVVSANLLTLARRRF